MSKIPRRTFLKRTTLALGAVGIGGLAAAEDSSGNTAEVNAAGEIREQHETADALTYRATQAQLDSLVPFGEVHQAGILTERPAQATFVALDSLAADRATLALALQSLSQRARALAVGGPIPVLEVDAPPADSGILGPSNPPDDLTVTIAFGASLFDGRYGLAGLRPPELTQMPTFPIDDLDPAQSHGDVLLQICANQRDTVVHTVRELLRSVRGTLQIRWMIDGFQGVDRGPRPKSSPRNLFAFRDGTANPLPSDAAMMDSLVWVRDDAPHWATGGTYMVVRIIRQRVEFWDRVALNEQQKMIGRNRATGAPLGGTQEFEDPDYASDPHGKRIPLDAHIRLANPRTAATADQRMLRRSYNYTRGYDAAGQLDQGLVFVAFNQSPTRQFVPVQTRLLNEPMIDYITPIGGGYFFAPPAAAGNTGWVGAGLFAVADSA
jgi:deferrochelatase/peroxidase EfeB